MVGAVARSFVLRAAAATAVAAAVTVPGMLGGGGVPASAQTSPTACVVNLLSTCLVSSATPTPSTTCVLILCPTPTPTPDPNQQTSSSSSSSTVPCDQLPTCPSPQPTCLLNSTDPTCLLATPGPTNCNCPSPSGSHTSSSPRRSTGGPSGGGTADATFGFFGSLSGLNGGPGASPTAGGPAVDIGIKAPPIPEIQPVGAASALHFGHAPILWPLFGALDLVALAGVFLVLRRVRARRPD